MATSNLFFKRRLIIPTTLFTGSSCIAVLLFSLFLNGLCTPKYVQGQITHRVSDAPVLGEEGNGNASYGSVTSNGSLVLFESAADNLTGDAAAGIFVRNVASESVDYMTSGTEPVISKDGLWFAFTALSGDSVFLRELTNGGSVIQVNASLGGDVAQSPSLSADGRYIVFSANATPGLLTDIYIYDRIDDELELVSNASGTPESGGDASSSYPQISSDGKFVTYLSKAGNLVSGVTGGVNRIYVRDVISAGSATRLASKSQSNTPSSLICSPPNLSSIAPVKVVFSCVEDGLVPSDSNGQSDTFVYDYSTDLISIVSDMNNTADGSSSLTAAPAITDDGSTVAFISAAENLLDEDSNGVADIFSRNIASGELILVSTASDSSQAGLAIVNMSMSPDGLFIVYQTAASDLVEGDANGMDDIFHWDRNGLFNDPGGFGFAAAVGSSMGGGDYLDNKGINKATLNLAVKQHFYRMRTLGPVIDIALYYNASDKMSTTVPDSFGRGWTLANDLRLRPGKKKSEAILVKGDGSEYVFSSPNDEDLTEELPAYPFELNPPPGLQDKITLLNGCFGAWSHWVYHDKAKRLDYSLMNNANHGFKVERIEDNNGNGVFYHRDYIFDEFLNIIREFLVQIYVYHFRDDCDPQTGCVDQRVIEFFYGPPVQDHPHGIGNYVTKIELPENDDRTILLNHNAAGDLISATDMAGGQQTFEYDSDGYMTRKTLDSKNVYYTWINRGEGSGKRIGSTSKGGKTTTYTLSDGNVQQASPSGKLTTFDVSNGKITAIGAPGGGTMSIQRNSDSLPTKVIGFDGNITTVSYDAEKRPIQISASIQSATPVVTTLSYDVAGNLASIISPTETSTFTYSDKNKLLSSTRSAPGETSVTTTYEYSVEGVIKKQLNSIGGTKEFTYDAYGNILTITDAADGVITFTYDPKFRCTQITDQNGNIKSITFDENDRLTKVTYDSVTGTPFIEWQYDGQLLGAFVDENGFLTRFDRNDFGSITRKTFPLGNSTIYTYNDDNKRISSQNGLGQIETVTYDDAGNPATVSDPLGRTTQKTFSDAGKLLTYTDPGNNTTSFEYGDKGELVRVVYADARATEYEHDSSLHVTKISNHRGQTTDMAYDSKGNILTKEYSSDIPDYGYVYDAAKNLITASYGTDEYNYTYTVRNEISSIAHAGTTVSYVYDPAGNLSQVNYPGTIDASYAYDSFNRVSIPPNFFNYNGDKSISFKKKANKVVQLDFGSYSVICEYDNAGNLTKETRSNGAVSDYVYDGNNRLISISHKTLGSTNIGSFVYTYNAADRIVSIDSSGLTDLLLTTERVMGQYSQNTLTRWNGNTSTTDGDGNITRAADFYNGVYSPDNQLMSISHSGQLISFTYDPNGMRRSKTINGVITNYLYDRTGRLLLELNSSDQVLASYYYIGDRLAAMRRNENTYFYHCDHLGNIIALTDGSGGLVNQYNYESFGVVHGSGNLVENPFTFNGAHGVVDDGNGLFYMKNRYYLAYIGRFMQKDPAFFASSSTLYDFGHNNPLSHVDPEGDFILSTIGLVSAAYGAYKTYRFFKDNSDRNMKRLKRMRNSSSINNLIKEEGNRKKHEKKARKEAANTAYSAVKSATEAATGIGSAVLGAAEFADEIYSDATQEEEVEDDSWW